MIAKEAAFHSKTEVNLESTASNELFTKMKETVLESLEEFKRQGSSWRFRSVLCLDLHTVKYEPLRGSSYIPLPALLAAKKAIINLKNKDDVCFKWDITRELNWAEQHSERTDTNIEKRERSSFGRNWNFQSISIISIILKIILLQFLLMYLVTKNWFILFESARKTINVSELLIYY